MNIIERELLVARPLTISRGKMVAVIYIIVSIVKSVAKKQSLSIIIIGGILQIIRAYMHLIIGTIVKFIVSKNLDANAFTIDQLRKLAVKISNFILRKNVKINPKKSRNEKNKLKNNYSKLITKYKILDVVQYHVFGYLFLKVLSLIIAPLLLRNLRRFFANRVPSSNNLSPNMNRAAESMGYALGNAASSFFNGR